MSDEINPRPGFSDEENVGPTDSDPDVWQMKPSTALNSSGEVKQNVPLSSVFFLGEIDYRDLEVWGSSVEPDQRMSSFWWILTIASIVIALFFLFQLPESRNQDAIYVLVPIVLFFAGIAIFCQFKLGQNIRMAKAGRTIPGELIKFAKANINLPRGSLPLFSVEYKFVNPAGEVIYATAAYQPSFARFNAQKPDVKSGTPVAVLYNDANHYKML